MPKCMLLHGLCALFLLALVAPVPAHADAAVPSVTPREVRVERVRPSRSRLESLRFLKANRDFIRARLDLLRERPGDALANANRVDPRWLAYGDLMRGALAGADSVRAVDDARQRRELFASVTELGALEQQLDQLERQLAAQRGRLGVLQADFTGHQRTELVLLLRGAPATDPLLSVSFTLEDAGERTVSLSDEERASLRAGGILELFHGLVEPRDQVVELALHLASGPDAVKRYVTLAPPRDQLSFLQWNLAAPGAAGTPADPSATTWVLDASPQWSDGAGAKP